MHWFCSNKYQGLDLVRSVFEPVSQGETPCVCVAARCQTSCCCKLISIPGMFSPTSAWAVCKMGIFSTSCFSSTWSCSHFRDLVQILQLQRTWPSAASNGLKMQCLVSCMRVLFFWLMCCAEACWAKDLALLFCVTGAFQPLICDIVAHIEIWVLEGSGDGQAEEFMC